VLYLIKASRVQEYHQQNVAILGAPDDDIISITYSETWVTPGVEMQAGMACVIVFADTPYSRFVPVRFGILETVTLVETRTMVEVRLKAFVRPGGTDLLNELWARFESDDQDRPGRRFVVEDENPGLLQPQSHDEQDEAWRSVVDGLEPNGFFKRSTFARVLKTVDEQGGEIDFGQPLRIGSQVGLEIEVRSNADSGDEIRFYVDAEPVGSVVIEGSSTLPASGVAHIRFTPVMQGAIRARFRLFPEPLKSSQPQIEMTVLAQMPSQVVHEVVHVVAPAAGSRPDVELLINRLDREANLTKETWFGLYQDVFVPWHPDDQEILVKFARLAYQLQRYSECSKTYSKVVDRYPEDEAYLLFASLREGKKVDVDLVKRIDLDAEATFMELIDSLKDADPSTLEAVTRVLEADVLGDSNLERYARAIFNRLPSVDYSIELAEQVGMRVNPETAGDLLIQRWPREVSAPPAVVAKLLDWKVQKSKLLPYLLRSLSDSERDADWPGVEKIVALARELFTERPVWNQVYVIAGSALLESGDRGLAQKGFGYISEVVASSAGSGDMDTAVRYASVLIGYAGMKGDKALQAQAEAQLQLVTAALDQSRPLKDWYALQEDHSIKRLKVRLNGCVLHLVGDKTQPWRSDLEISLGLREVRWHEAEKNKGINTDWAGSLDGEKDFVVVLWERIGHPIYTPLKDKCDRQGVTFMESRTSKRDVIAQLERVIFGEDGKSASTGA
jgi:hypothetical protein